MAVVWVQASDTKLVGKSPPCHDKFIRGIECDCESVGGRRREIPAVGSRFCKGGIEGAVGIVSNDSETRGRRIIRNPYGDDPIRTIDGNAPPK